MALIDYKKSYDIVPQSWIINCLEMYKISHEVINFIEKTMKTWRVEFTTGGSSLTEAKIRRCICQGDALLLYSHIQYHYDIIIKTREDFFRKNIYLSIYLQGSKGLCGVLLWEAVGERTELQYFEPHSYGRQLEAQRPTLLGDSFLYCILSTTFSNFNSSGAPRVPSAWCGLTYHILSIPPTVTHQGLQEPLRTGVPFSITLRLYNSNCNSNSDFLSWPSYIIV